MRWKGDIVLYCIVCFVLLTDLLTNTMVASEESSEAPLRASRSVAESSVDPAPVSIAAPWMIAPTTKRRGKPNLSSNPVDAVTLAALSAATQHMTAAGFHGLASLLTNILQENQQSTSIIPSVEAVQQAARKAIAEQPVWIHWSKQDMAPQFKCDSSRLTLTGAMRGYRMARASHGVSSGCYYFECLILPGPSTTEILHSLPPNARLGPGLREKLQETMDWEQKEGKGSSVVAPDSQVTTETVSNKKRKLDEDRRPPQVGGHLRIGWSMRTGDLQAPVGYDKWSYGIRDIGGSILHCSQRQDNWGGEDFRAHDVFGCLISFDESEGDTDVDGDSNHIRFFKNGDCMGQFVSSKGRREGGEAFRNIENGIYYPAVSSYMGGSVRTNFGPYWIFPPKRSRLPTGLKNMKAMASVLSPPLSPSLAVTNATATSKLFRKPEHQQALKDAVQAEAEVHCQAYSDFLKKHIAEIRQARMERGQSVNDLPEVSLASEGNIDSESTGA